MKKALLLILTTLLLFVAGTALAADYYVKMSGDDNNTGESWGTAFRTVQKALDVAALSTDLTISVHIAAGLYKPTKDKDGNFIPVDARNKTFALPPRVSLYGGYPAEGGTTRDWQEDQTILSGDFNNDDTWDSYHINTSRELTLAESKGNIVDNSTKQFNMPEPTGSIVNGTFPVQNFIWLPNADSFDDNAYTVIYMVDIGRDVVIDGLYITGAGGSSYGALYHGIYSDDSSSATISNAVISGNRQDYGAGIYNESGGTLTITNVSIIGNRSYMGGGGINTEGKITLTNSIITRNYSHSGSGAGLYVTYFDGEAIILNSTISYNYARYGAGGIYNNDVLTMSNSTVLGNFGGNAGGIYGSYNNTMSISHSTIADNYANSDAGGIYNDRTATISHSTISGNYALSGSSRDGGGIFNSDNAFIDNCTITGNNADDLGGGMANTGTAVITHTTIAKNKAGYGGGLYNEKTVYIRASIVAENIEVTEYSNCYSVATINDMGYNLTNDNYGCDFNTDENSIITMADWTPELADNGGPTQTIMTPPEAVDVIPYNFYGTIGIEAPDTDQRDYDRPYNTLYDIGSVEEGVSPGATIYVDPTPVNGKITSTGNLNCGTDADECSEVFPTGTNVTLTATADSGYLLTGWTGDCSGAGSASTCNLSLDSDKTVSATFEVESVPTYTLAVNPQPTNGTITDNGNIYCGAQGSNCSETFDENTNVTLTAEPEDGYIFSAWTGACSSVTSTSCTITMDSNKTVGATFETESVPTYTLTVDPQPTNGTITDYGSIYCGAQGSNCSETFDENTNVTLTAEPEDGYIFSAWTGACSSVTSTSCTITMDSNKTVSATFELASVTTYTLTVNPQPTNGTITDYGDIYCGAQGSNCNDTFDENTSVTLTAEPEDGYIFAAWTGVCSSVTSTTCTVTMNYNKTVSATFETESVPTYSLVVSPQPSNGTITDNGNIDCGAQGNNCNDTFDENTSVTLTAEPEDGYILSAWTGACSSVTSTSCTITMDSNKTVSATFEADSGATYTLTVTPQPSNGTITDNGTINCGAQGANCSETFDENTSVTLTALPKDGYKFVAWTGACSSETTNSCSIDMDNNKTVSANFASKTNILYLLLLSEL